MALTFRSLADQFLAWVQSCRSPATAAYYRHHLAGFAGLVGSQLASDIKRGVLIAWGKSWHRVQAVQRCYNWAVEDAELLPVNPFRRVRRPPMRERKRILDARGVVRLMRATTPAFRVFLLAARETFARPQEVRAITWESLQWPGQPLDFERAARRGHIVAVLHDYKARRLRHDPNTPRVLLISPRLGRYLVRRRNVGHELEGPIFVNERGRPWTGNAVRQAMARLRRQLHLSADHRGEHVVAYTIRHSQATQAAAAGIRDRLLAELMGHTSVRTTARYQHLDVRHLQDALGILRRTRTRSSAPTTSPGK